jgi:hypothetical protein
MLVLWRDLLVREERQGWWGRLPERLVRAVGSWVWLEMWLLWRDSLARQGW